MKYYAHSGKGSERGDSRADWQPLADHLRQVAMLARRFAREAAPECRHLHEAAYWAGLLHDLGKYREGFQRRLADSRVRGEETHHRELGAAHAIEGGRPDIAFCIAGHHGGLPDRAVLKEMLNGPSGRSLLTEVLPIAQDDCPELTQSIAGSLNAERSPDDELLIRLLFGCLVDADWTDTGAHFGRANGLEAQPEPPALDAAKHLATVLAYVQRKSMACTNDSVREIRRQILKSALGAAEWPPGLFSMTVPTGGGKTLSGLAFALKHAKRHGLRRVIYVAPYLSIIEQNAREIRRALGLTQNQDLLFEHHSLSEPLGGRRSGRSPKPNRSPTGRKLVSTTDHYHQRAVLRKPVFQPAGSLPQTAPYRSKRRDSGRVPDVTSGSRGANLCNVGRPRAGDGLQPCSVYRNTTGVVKASRSARRAGERARDRTVKAGPVPSFAADSNRLAQTAGSGSGVGRG